MGPISKTQVEHDALVQKLKTDITGEMNQINDLVNGIEDDEYELYYLYFKLTQINATLAHEFALMNKGPVAMGAENVSLHAKAIGATVMGA